MPTAAGRATGDETLSEIRCPCLRGPLACECASAGRGCRGPVVPGSLRVPKPGVQPPFCPVRSRHRADGSQRDAVSVFLAATKLKVFSICAHGRLVHPLQTRAVPEDQPADLRARPGRGQRREDAWATDFDQGRRRGHQQTHPRPGSRRADDQGAVCVKYQPARRPPAFMGAPGGASSAWCALLMLDLPGSGRWAWQAGNRGLRDRRYERPPAKVADGPVHAAGGLEIPVLALAGASRLGSCALRTRHLSGRSNR